MSIISIDEILEVLPHRYPFLLVDRVDEIDKDRLCKGYKNVTINEPFFQGHYPGFPIMPGVLILEAMAQAGAIMLLRTDAYRGRIPLIGAIDEVKFRRPVRPGDVLVSTVELLWVKGAVGRISCIAEVDGEMAAKMLMTFKLQERKG